MFFSNPRQVIILPFPSSQKNLYIITYHGFYNVAYSFQYNTWHSVKITTGHHDAENCTNGYSKLDEGESQQTTCWRRTGHIWIQSKNLRPCFPQLRTTTRLTTDRHNELVIMYTPKMHHYSLKFACETYSIAGVMLMAGQHAHR